MKSGIQNKFLLCGLALMLASQSAFAGVGSSLMQTAPVKSVGEFEAKLHNDIIFNNGGGFNISPHLQTGIIERFLDVDVHFGTGTTDFQMGALAKFNLLPDIEGQVGLSFLGGFTYLRDEGRNASIWTLGALVSKRLESNVGFISPYGAFEFETVFANNDQKVPLTLLVGSKWEPSRVQPWFLYTEFSVSLRKSNYALSLGAGYPF